jgi:subtilisin family serine protease
MALLRGAAARVAQVGAKAAGEDASAPESGGERYLVINLEFDTEQNRRAYAVEGAPVFNALDRFADIFLPAGKADELAPLIEGSTGLVRLDVVNSVAAPRPPSPGKAASRGEPDAIVRGGLSGLTGKGTIIAIVDSGVDFRNKDFIRVEDGKPVSRLLYLWDTTSGDYDAGRGGSAAPIRFPNGASVGTVFTRDQLTADLRASSSSIGARDLNGHGTSCAGIAAGNGSNDRRFVGVAPDADIIAVRIGGSGSSGLENGWVLNAACAWMDQVAGSSPLVVSCSFGGHNGAHDGRTIEELQLNARFAADRKGRALCIAAGNEGGDAIHAEVTLRGSDKPADLAWTAQEGASLSLIFSTTDLRAVRFRPPSGTSLPKLSATTDPATKQTVVPIRKMAKGTSSLQLYTADGTELTCDAYLSGGSFDKSCVSYSKVIARPGTASAAITVGSYDWNDRFEKDGQAVTVSPGGNPMVIGSLSSYSSTGPSRDSSVVKPDLVAPGQFYSASAPLVAIRGILDTSKNYQLFNGTSAATPYVAGVVALMFEKKPDLAFGEVKRILREAVSSDRHTGSVPNSRWGHGKLDLAAARKAIAGVR